MAFFQATNIDHVEPDGSRHTDGPSSGHAKLSEPGHFGVSFREQSHHVENPIKSRGNKHNLTGA